MAIAGVALAVPLMMLALLAVVVMVAAAGIFMIVFSVLSLVDRLLGMLQMPSGNDGRRNVRVLRDDPADPPV